MCIFQRFLKFPVITLPRSPDQGGLLKFLNRVNRRHATTLDAFSADTILYTHTHTHFYKHNNDKYKITNIRYRSIARRSDSCIYEANTFLLLQLQQLGLPQNFCSRCPQPSYVIYYVQLNSTLSAFSRLQLSSCVSFVQKSLVLADKQSLTAALPKKRRHSFPKLYCSSPQPLKPNIRSCCRQWGSNVKGTSSNM